MRRLVLSLVAILCLALTVAACGSATNDYRGKVADVQKKYAAQMTDLTTKVTTDDQHESGGGVGVAVGARDRRQPVRRGRRRVKPPADKQPLADQLVGAYRTLAQASLDLKAALDTKDTDKLNKALEEFNKATADESAAIDAFNAAD